jgi:hypothetical protein
MSISKIDPGTQRLETHQKRKSAGFFSIDLGAFRYAAIGGLNSAIAYLTMARGTGRDNRTTQWSIHAIETRTAISRPNAKNAVQDLLKRGVCKRIRTGKHPIYELVPGKQIPSGPFTRDEQAAIAAVRNKEPLHPAHQAVAEALTARGIFRQVSKKTYEIDQAAIDALVEPLAVWLPNALIDGVANEVPAVELIRQTRNLHALRLLIELYAVQFLPHYGGVPHELLKGNCKRDKVGEQGAFVVWGFRPTNMTAGRRLYRHFLTGQYIPRPDGKREDAGMVVAFWPAVETIKRLGLVEMVGMLLDGDDDAAEIIHPYAINGGEPAEFEVATAAENAAWEMLTEGQRIWHEYNEYKLVPVLKHIEKAAMVEIVRLRYRPHTAATAAWYARMRETTAQHLKHYQALAEKSSPTIRQ